MRKRMTNRSTRIALLEDTQTGPPCRNTHDFYVMEANKMSVNRNRQQNTCRVCGKRACYTRFGYCEGCFEIARAEVELAQLHAATVRAEIEEARAIRENADARA